MTNSYDVDHGLNQCHPGPLGLEAPDNTLARTGNTARDQEMYAAGLEKGEENAKHNAAIRGGVPDGWKLVPVEPTIDMVADADEAGNVLGPRARRIYAAMLAAAPASPVSTGEPNRDAVDAARYRLAASDCILVLRGDAALGRDEWDRKLDRLATQQGAK